MTMDSKLARLGLITDKLLSRLAGLDGAVQDYLLGTSDRLPTPPRSSV